jgi:amino acid adenylation domain-containing protein
MQTQIQGFQLSPQQRRLLLLQRDSSAYRAQCVFLLKGNLNTGVLKLALQEVVKRHEILRTTFPRPPGIRVPIQVVGSGCPLIFSEHDWQDWNSQAQIAKLEALVEQESQEPFNLEQGPLLRATLVTLLPNQHVLLTNLPALCADTVALTNLVWEISRCYATYLQGEQLIDEPLQYADLAEWQNQLLEVEAAETGKEYWQQPDALALEALKLPLENRFSGNLEFAPQCLTLPIESDLVLQMEAIAQQYKTSVSTFLLTCWQILLWRLTGQSDLVIGTGFDGRNYEDLKPAIGLFARYLPLSCRLQADDLLSRVWKRMDELVDELAEWQETFSWEPIAESNGSGIELPFFPLCFDYEEKPPQYVAGGVTFEISQQSVCIDRFKVKLACVYWHDSLSTQFHYDPNFFTTEDIQRLAKQFQTLLANAVHRPETAISELDILSPTERQQLLVEFNNTTTDFPEDRCLHQLFEEQATRTPDNTAVVFVDQQLSYAELDQRVNQLAHHLQQLGVGPDVLVGIYVERSPETVVGVLGILKAGGAYLPLDPAYPRERLAFILEDTQAPVLLTQSKLVERLPESNAKLLCLDTDWERIAQQATQNPVSGVTSDNLAYAIYTSGSTGKPKGTLIPHRGLVNYLTWCRQAYTVEQGKGATVHSSLAFDLTITGLFSPLLVGLPVKLLPEDPSINSLSTALRHESNLSLVKITPAQLTMLSQQLSPSEAAGRTRAFIIGGENLAAESITFWQDFAPDTMLVNEYGPTETVVGCCIYRVPQGKHQSGSVPIGRPIANTQLYILNQHLQPLPTGVPGELYIGGIGLAWGYLNHFELTAETFIPNPFSHVPGTRMYKTGDLVQYLPDGNLEFLGRVDHQVKIRGYRIELEEIEAVLAQHPAIHSVVVLVREDEPGDQRLVAYVVPAQEVMLPINELRSFLSEKLPEYMVPSAFVLLKELPLTFNGKVNRRALPAPEQTRPKLAETFVAPRTSVEERLAEIWAGILRLERVGIHDNFFDLGGHSLLATQLISRLHDVFQVEPPLRLFFEAPTIADLAVMITQELAEKTDEVLLAQALAELEQLSEDEARVVLAARKQEREANE